MKSISEMLAIFLLIVITISLSIFAYIYVQSIFSGLKQKNEQTIKSHTTYTSFSIPNIFLNSQNGTIDFVLYNNGNIPINLSKTIFTLNYHIINAYCNNSIIYPNQQTICYIPLIFYTSNSSIYLIFPESGNFLLGLIYNGYSLQTGGPFNAVPIQILYNISLVIYNSQNQNTPAPFQQEIVLYSSNFSNQNMWNSIISNPLNILFVSSFNPYDPLYSWIENVNQNNITVWINLPNGIPANSNTTLYMYVTDQNIYPYTGINPQIIYGYDNGQNAFLAYGYFNNTYDNWIAKIYYGPYYPTPTPYGIEIMIPIAPAEANYILPPNNIPPIPVVVEEAWYVNYAGCGGDENAINLFGNGILEGTYALFDYWCDATGLSLYNQYTQLASTSFISSPYTFYSWMILNQTYVAAGYYNYSSSQVWAPLTLLGSLIYTNYTYNSSLSYNPFQYSNPSLMIYAFHGAATSAQYIEWVVARAYPPNGVMPQIVSISVS